VSGGDGDGQCSCAPLPPSLTGESGVKIEDYIRFLFCHLFGPVNHEQTWKDWERSGEKLDYQ
jgi:hypothetical protein